MRKLRAESYGRVKKLQDEGEVPTIGVAYVYMRSEQEKEEEKGMPIVVAKDSKTKMIMARVAPRKELDSYAMETVKKMVEKLLREKIILRSDSELPISALKEAVRTERERVREGDVEVAL